MPRWLAWLCLSLTIPAICGVQAPAVEPLPPEPLAIGTEPQFVFDNYLVDNHWGRKYGTQIVRRVVHSAVKHEHNPVIAGRGGYACALKDEQAGIIRLWYQDWSSGGKGKRAGKYAIAYAQSPDGLRWEVPRLGLFEWKGSKDNNAVWVGPKGARASSPCLLLEIPDRDRRGYRFVMTYSGFDGLRIIGSQDGIHWDPASDTHLKKLHSDTLNSPVYDPARDEYVMYCRAKHIYRTFDGDALDTGESRRVARMVNKTLWDPWEADPQTILVPDELDFRDGFTAIYGMPTRYYGRVFWGFAWPFRYNDQIHTELAWSRDGVRFERSCERPKFLQRGPEEAWDGGMVFGGCHWIEMGSEWWFYYGGWDGPHGSRQRTAGIGLARLRKEGFISMRGPQQGGVLATRRILWPGGPLLLNVDAREGAVKVRVSDEGRKPLPGYNYDDCEAFSGDSVAHEVKWKDKSIADLAGKVIRLEIFLQEADLYTLRAGGRSVNAAQPGGARRP